MEYHQAMFTVERHQAAPLWRLLGIWRCAACRRRWPCRHYREARGNLLRHDRTDIARLVRRNTRWPGP